MSVLLSPTAWPSDATSPQWPDCTCTGAHYRFAVPSNTVPSRETKPDVTHLCAAALRAREHAYAPYSRFRVGAALLCDDGTVVPGCNVENSSYGLCLCAERSAVAGAIAGGRRQFVAIAIATASSPPSPPCGMCRQVLAEFAPDLRVVMTNPGGELVETTARTLLPGGFDTELLQSGQDPKSES
ncbi:MAG: cytidine deaminase [Myxococcota bacterium]